MPLKRHLLIDVCRSLEILITYSREVSYAWRITKSRAIRVSITSGASALTRKYSGGLRMDLSRVCVANDGSHAREMEANVVFLVVLIGYCTFLACSILFVVGVASGV